jgi:hypothetical protein
MVPFTPLLYWKCLVPIKSGWLMVPLICACAAAASVKLAIAISSVLIVFGSLLVGLLYLLRLLWGKFV